MKTIDITVSRLIPASATEVFDAWIDPKNPGSFFYDNTKVVVNAVVEGLFYWAHRSKGGAIHPHFGRFLKLDRGKLVEYTWMSEGTRGSETTVSISFESRDKGTQMTIHHTGLPDDDSGRAHEQGWGYFLGEMEKSVSK